MNNTGSKLTFPGQVLKNSNTIGTGLWQYGIVTISEEGIYYRSEGIFVHLLMRSNLMNKLIWKFNEGKTIPFSSIVEFRLYKDNGIEIITDEINGSYYFCLPSAMGDDRNELLAFLEECRKNGYNSAREGEGSARFQKLTETSERLHKSKTPIAAILLVFGLLILIVTRSILISFMVFFFSATPAKQSKNPILYAAAVLLAVITALMLLPRDI